jgi:hypothetical protein
LPGFDSISFLGVVFIFISAPLLLVIDNWRISLSFFALQYLGVTILVGASWPLMMAATKLVSGWIAIAVLGMAVSSITGREQPAGNPFGLGRRDRLFTLVRVLSAWVFRLFAAMMVILVAFSLVGDVSQWIPGISDEQTVGSLVLLGLGLLHLGSTASPMHVVMALLTILSGFEIVYASIESSTLVAGLLAGVNLGLALVGAYMLVAGAKDEEEAL